MASKYDLNVTPTQIITARDQIPDDYHCTCNLCQTKFLGDVFNIDKQMYYSQSARNRYMPKKIPRYQHNNPGHWIGYRFAIQQLTEENDIVFDPTVGTGTAIIEAENNGRQGIGIELEFSDTTLYYTQFKGTVIKGNALTTDISPYLHKESVQLMVNGTPYPVIAGGMSSDVPSVIGNSYGDYQHGDNIGKWKLQEYSTRIHELYTRFIPYLKPKGFLCIIIKDPISKKVPFNLHKTIVDNIILHNPNMVPYGWFIHKHIPPTLFINAYEANHGVICPVTYQTGIILQKQ